MADRVTKEIRSYNMANIKGKNTSIELKVRHYLFHHGFRYKINVKDLPGTPDIYISKYNVAIFINGCFWHHHYNCKLAYIPKTREKYWISKFNKNIDNDIKNKKELEQMDIKVITIWECEIKDCFQYRMESLLEEIKEKR